MSDELRIDKRFIVDLKGKSYPTWPGILDAATKTGLKSLTVKCIQFPSKENGGTAVCVATAVFEDGRVFEDYGDAGPDTCSPQIAKAALRMASTRAKGRVLRDAVNCGMTLLEELPEEETRQAARAPQAPAKPARYPNAPVVEEEQEVPVTCETDGCGMVLSPAEIQGCVRNAVRFGGHMYCTAHGKAVIAAGKAAAEG